jgi:hypothetical protein
MSSFPCSATSFPMPASSRALFHVTGLADPGLLPRLIEPVAKLGHVPQRLHMSREDGDGSLVTVDLRVVGVPQTDASRIESMLRAVVGVQQVIAVYERA